MPRPKEYDRVDHIARIEAEYGTSSADKLDWEHDHTSVCDCHGIRWLSEDVTIDRETGRVTCWDYDPSEAAEDRADDAWKERGL